MNEELNKSINRDKIIVKTSVIGIIVNVLLSIFKAVIGLMINSIAITLDAVNNISDAASSIITIIGAKLANRRPDKDHPFGHGRSEYLSAMIISVIVLYAGVTSLVESIKKIINPETPDYSTIALIIVAVSIVAKIILGRYVTASGKKAKSDSLINSGKDALLDAVITATTLVAAVVYLIWHVSLESYLAAAISLYIIKSGIDMLREAISRILGEHGNGELAHGIADTIRSFPDVHGVYDLVLHDYGPERYQGSVHIEVLDTFTANALDKLIRAITVKVYLEHNVALTAVGVYSINTTDEKAIKYREDITQMVLAHEYADQIHGFYLDEEEKTIRFDVVISFDTKDRDKVYADIYKQVSTSYPDYRFEITMDTDFISSTF